MAPVWPWEAPAFIASISSTLQVNNWPIPGDFRSYEHIRNSDLDECPRLVLAMEGLRVPKSHFF